MSIDIHGNIEYAFICKKRNMKCDVTTQRLLRVSHIYHIYWILRSYGMIQKVNDESVFSFKSSGPTWLVLALLVS
jgi:hypothetical protein